MSLTIQERIKDLRVEHGLTLKELAVLNILRAIFADASRQKFFLTK